MHSGPSFGAMPMSTPGEPGFGRSTGPAVVNFPEFDPAKRRIVNNPAAEKLWSREYRPGWEPKI